MFSGNDCCSVTRWPTCFSSPRFVWAEIVVHFPASAKPISAPLSYFTCRSLLLGILAACSNLFLAHVYQHCQPSTIYNIIAVPCRDELISIIRRHSQFSHPHCLFPFRSEGVACFDQFSSGRGHYCFQHVPHLVLARIPMDSSVSHPNLRRHLHSKWSQGHLR